MVSEDGQQSLGEYLIESVLSERGNTRVYLARDEPLDKLVVLKRCQVLTPDDHDHVERLFQGARAVASLDHPNVVKLHAVRGNPGSGDCYAVMEYANGGSVADLIKKEGHLSLEKALDIAIQVCTALDHIHRRRNIVHGNIKPSNILLFYDGDQMVAKIADFGLSERAADGQVDLNALGAVLYEMLIGNPPSGDITPPRELRPAVFSQLNKSILTALAKTQSGQFRDAKTMLDALQEARNLCTVQHTQADAKYKQGLRLVEQKKWQEAVDAFEQAYDLNPEIEDIEQRLKDVRLRLEWETGWHDAERLLRVEQWKDALRQLKQISTLDQTYRAEEVKEKAEEAQQQLALAGLYRDAQAAEGAGHRQQAIALCGQILAVDPGYDNVAQSLNRLQEEERLEELRAQGKELIQQEKWEEAIKVYEQILEERPGDPEAISQHDYAQRQIELDRLLVQAQTELARGNLDAAISTLRDITLSKPKHRDAAVLLADAVHQQRVRELHQKAEQAVERRQWSEAEKLLVDLLRLEPDDPWTQQQLYRVRKWQAFDSEYRRAKRDHEAGHWDEAIDKFEKVLGLAKGADLDLYNYQDIRSLLAEARKYQQLDTLRKQGEMHEATKDLPALIQVQDQMLAVDPGNPEVLKWKKSTLERILHSPVRRWGFLMAIVLGAVLLPISISRLAEVSRAFGRLVVTSDSVGAAVSIFALFVSFIGLVIPAEKLYAWLGKDRRRIACVILVPVLVAACLLALVIKAFVPGPVPTPTPTLSEPTPIPSEAPIPSTTPIPVPPSPVVLKSPENGSECGSAVTLRWNSYTLQDQEYYRLKVWAKGQDFPEIYHTIENYFGLPLLSLGEYSWAVAIVYAPAPDEESVRQESDLWIFEVVPPTPIVHSISPTSTLRGTAMPVVVSGENFTISTALAISIPLQATFVNSGTITATVPTTLEVGTYPVIVQDSHGRGVSSTVSFVVKEPAKSTTRLWNPQTPVPPAPLGYDPGTTCVVTPCAPAPQLVGPDGGAELTAGKTMEFKWTWAYCLPPGWKFAIRLSDYSPPDSYQYIDDPNWVSCQEGRSVVHYPIKIDPSTCDRFTTIPGTYYWNMAVTRSVEGGWERLSEVSEIRWFTIERGPGGSGGGTDEPP